VLAKPDTVLLLARDGEELIGYAPRLYRRRGFRPTWLYLSRFAGRD
jgi:hypothetical protein